MCSAGLLFYKTIRGHVLKTCSPVLFLTSADLMVPGSVCEVDLLYNSEFMVPEFISNEQSVSQGSSWHSLYQREALEDTAMESFMLQVRYKSVWFPGLREGLVRLWRVTARARFTTCARRPANLPSSNL